MTRGLAAAVVALLAGGSGCGSDDGARQLVDVAVEPPGDNCVDGGTVVRVGEDGDGDGALGADEVAEVTYLCNADDGPPHLVDVASEPAGPNCAAGGVAVQTGLDDDLDGELDADEVDETRYVCDSDPTPDVVYGNLLIDEADEAAQLAGVRVVTGSVIVDVLGLPALDLASLEQVGWDLTMWRASVADLAAPQLRVVGHDLAIQTQEVVSMDLSGLREVGRTLDISEEELVDLDLSSLVLVGAPGSDGDLRLTGLLTEVDLPNLSHVERFIRIRGQTQTVSAVALVHAYSLAVDDCPALETLDFPALVDAEFVGVTDSETLAVVTGFPALSAVGELAIDRNADVAAVFLPALSSVRTLRVQSNPMLPTCAAEALRDQTSPNTVLISGNDDEGVCP